MATRSATSRLINEIIAAGPAPLLKESGYQKSARSFVARQGEVYKIVEFQPHRANSPELAEFTVNLTIAPPFVHEAWTGGPFPEDPIEAQWLVLQRLGDLLPRKRSWWKVTPKTKVEPVAAEIASALSEYGLPFLDKHSDLNVVIQEAENKQGKYLLGSNRDLFLAMVYSHLRNREEAVRLIKKAGKWSGTTGFGETVAKVRQRLGLAADAE